MRIHAIQTGTVTVKERQREGAGPGRLRLLNAMRDRRWTRPLPILAWLVVHPEGLILVDTGETARATQAGYFPRWHPYFRFGMRATVDPEHELGSQLSRLGYAPRDVRWVVMTHLHTDHAGGLEHVRHANVVVSKVEYSEATGRLAKVRGYLPHRWPEDLAFSKIGFARQPLGPFPSSHVLVRSPDVTIIPTPGHTPGHMSVVVPVEDRLVMLAGDVSYTQELMLASRVDGVSTDVETSRRTLERVRALAAGTPTVYLPSHDPDATRRLAELEVVSPDEAAAGPSESGGMPDRISAG